jgi:hypothetical protein
VGGIDGRTRRPDAALDARANHGRGSDPEQRERKQRAAPTHHQNGNVATDCKIRGAGGGMRGGYVFSALRGYRDPTTTPTAALLCIHSLKHTTQ